MRSAKRDQDGFTIFSGKFNGATGALVAVANSIPFQCVRTALGQYKVYFDNSILPFAVTASVDIGSALPYAYGPGTFSVNTLNGAGALTDGGVTFVVTARKMGA